MVTLAEGFVERGLQVDVVLVKAEGSLITDLPSAVRLVDLHAPKVTLSVPRLVRYLRCHRPAVLLSTSNHANVVAVAATRLADVGTRIVLRQANTVSRRTRPRCASRYLVRWGYPRADAIIAGSLGVARDLAVVTGEPQERIHVVPNPVVKPEIFQLSRDRPQHPWFLDGGYPVVLAVGRLAPVKDFPTLIRAFARVREHRTCRLLILGDGEERSRLEALIRELGLQGSVSMPGFVKNPFAYMARAAVFVLSSKSEGLPGALIQALACGAPVIATDCECGPREVLQEGRFGRLVPVGDVRALSTAICSELDAPNGMQLEAWKPYVAERAVQAYLRVLGLRGTAPSRGHG
jgi:glycosyltransferase involved in cell wall biosynthesis